MATLSLEKPSDAKAPAWVAARRVRLKRLLALFGVTAVAAAAINVRLAYRQTERREAYLPDLERMARRAPFDGSLEALLAGRQAQAGDFAAAAATLKRAVAAGEAQADVWKTWAASAAAAGDRAGSASILRLGMQTLRSPADRAELQAALDRAQSLDRNAEPPRLAHAISPEGLGPLIARRTQGSFLNGLAAWWGERHPTRSGFATREEWARRHPNDPQALRWWGLALIPNRRLPAALDVLTRAADLAPRDADIHLALADLLRQQGMTGKAGLEYEACLRLRRNWLPALLGLGQVALDKSLIALSVSVFQKASAVGPNSADAWIGLGRAYYATHIQLGQAVSAFQHGERLAPNRTDYFDDYFKALRMTFRYPEAEALIRRRIQVTPDDAEARYLYALILEDFQPTPERAVEAEKQLRASLQFTPHSEAAEVRLAELLMRRHRSVEAVPLLQDVLQQDNLNVQAIRALAGAYRQAGQPQLAAKFLRDAAAPMRFAQQVADAEDQEHRNPADADAHETLARLYAQDGRKAEAQREHDFAALLRAHPHQAGRGMQALDAATSVSHPAQ